MGWRLMYSYVLCLMTYVLRPRGVQEDAVGTIYVDTQQSSTE